jgi:hypothetical protein
MPQGTQPNQSNIIRPHQYTTIEYMTGPNRKGPKRCLHCRKPFKQGETWQRHTSPKESRQRSYVVGIHSACLSQ